MVTWDKKTDPEHCHKNERERIKEINDKEAKTQGQDGWHQWLKYDKNNWQRWIR